MNLTETASFQGCHGNLYKFAALLSPDLLHKYHWFNLLQEVINTREPGCKAAQILPANQSCTLQSKEVFDFYLPKAKAVAKLLLQTVGQNPGVFLKPHFYHMDIIPSCYREG